jgi:hypothetical protein
MSTDLTPEPEIYEKILTFVLEETGTRKCLTRQTDLLRDLGVDGDDASEFMYNFGEKFQVDLSNFRFDNYFGGEGLSLIIFIKSLFSPPVKSSCTIELLFDAASNRHWPVSA